MLLVDPQDESLIGSRSELYEVIMASLLWGRCEVTYVQPIANPGLAKEGYSWEQYKKPFPAVTDYITVKYTYML